MSEADRVYTLSDLEEAQSQLDQGDSGRHSNPGRTRRHNLRAFERDSEVSQRIEFIKQKLIEQGDLPGPNPELEEEKIERARIKSELDRLYPNAESRKIVEL
jgi:hypothetical protein